MAAMPWPPPMHICFQFALVTRRASFYAASRVSDARTVAVFLTGWLREMPPPFTLEPIGACLHPYSDSTKSI